MRFIMPPEQDNRLEGEEGEEVPGQKTLQSKESEYNSVDENIERIICLD
jgi:hypothetical protein